MAGKKILFVDDHEAFRQFLAEQLQLHAKFTIKSCSTARDAIDQVKQEHYDAILLDVGLPDMDGREVCRLMRRRGVKSPIIMLTAADSDADTILGLDAGANDYVTKPLRIGVLLARLRAHLRQHEQSENVKFTIGPYTYTPSSKILVEEETNRKVRLTGRENAILKYLYRSSDKTISRLILLDQVWGDHARVTKHTIETNIHRLRQKIERDPSNAEILVTRPGGYQLIPRPTLCR